MGKLIKLIEAWMSKRDNSVQYLKGKKKDD